MNSQIILTKGILEKLDPANFLAITIAEDGAMGDPGAIEIVDRDLRLYHTHFDEIDQDLLRSKIHFLSTLRLMFGEISGLPADWTGLYTGYGNYLFLRPELAPKVTDYVKEHYLKGDVSFVVELYSHWYDALRAIAEGN